MSFWSWITFGLVGRKQTTVTPLRKLRQERRGRYWVHVVDDINADDFGDVVDVLIDGVWQISDDIDEDITDYLSDYAVTGDIPPEGFGTPDMQIPNDYSPMPDNSPPPDYIDAPVPMDIPVVQPDTTDAPTTQPCDDATTQPSDDYDNSTSDADTGASNYDSSSSNTDDSSSSVDSGSSCDSSSDS